MIVILSEGTCPCCSKTVDVCHKKFILDPDFLYITVSKHIHANIFKTL